MEKWFTLTARSPKYGMVPAGKYPTLNDAKEHAGRFMPGIEYLITEYSYDGQIRKISVIQEVC